MVKLGFLSDVKNYSTEKENNNKKKNTPPSGGGGGGSAFYQRVRVGEIVD